MLHAELEEAVEKEQKCGRNVHSVLGVLGRQRWTTTSVAIVGALVARVAGGEHADVACSAVAALVANRLGGGGGGGGGDIARRHDDELVGIVCRVQADLFARIEARAERVAGEKPVALYEIFETLDRAILAVEAYLHKAAEHARRVLVLLELDEEDVARLS